MAVVASASLDEWDSDSVGLRFESGGQDFASVDQDSSTDALDFGYGGPGFDFVDQDLSTDVLDSDCGGLGSGLDGDSKSGGDPDFDFAVLSSDSVEQGSDGGLGSGSTDQDFATVVPDSAPVVQDFGSDGLDFERRSPTPGSDDPDPVFAET